MSKVQVEWGNRDQQTRARAFLGTISARKVCSEKVPTHASPGPAAEEGANAYPGEVAEGSDNTGVGAMLEG